MQRLSKLWRLPVSERRLVSRALLNLAAIRVGLWVLPLRAMIRRLESSKAAPSDQISGHVSPDQIAWALRVVSRYLPGAQNCLVQALTAHRLLTQQGYPAQLRIGTARDADGRFRAHAWVEYAGRIVIGGAGAAQYTPFPALKEQSE